MKSELEFLELRGLRHAVRHWGRPGAPRLFLLHGWMDSSATFQFLVQSLTRDWHVIAPDWRGYGASERLGRPYWFPDYYADLDGLLQHYSPDEPARLAGHSMGGSIAAMYAGLRPERVARLAVLDFLGLPAVAPETAPTQLRQWLAQLGDVPRMRDYPDHAALARRLQVQNPRLNEQRAGFLAENVSRLRPDGRVEMACDPWHKVPSPTPYRLEETLACWRAVVAPVLLLFAESGFVQERLGNAPEELQRRIDCFGHCQVLTIADSGHNLQHDQPERVAAALEAFFPYP